MWKSRTRAKTRKSFFMLLKKRKGNWLGFIEKLAQRGYWIYIVALDDLTTDLAFFERLTEQNSQPKYTRLMLRFGTMANYRRLANDKVTFTSQNWQIVKFNWRGRCKKIKVVRWTIGLKVKLVDWNRAEWSCTDKRDYHEQLYISRAQVDCIIERNKSSTRRENGEKIDFF